MWGCLEPASLDAREAVRVIGCVPPPPPCAVPQEENQKLGLCEALLEVGDWPSAQQLMDKLPDHYAVSQPHIARQLCLLVHTLLEPLYAK